MDFEVWIDDRIENTIPTTLRFKGLIMETQESLSSLAKNQHNSRLFLRNSPPIH